MSYMWLILLWILSNGCNSNTPVCCVEPTGPSCPCGCDDRNPIIQPRCDYPEEPPFLPGGRPFGAFDGNQTCGCEEKPVT